MTEPIFAKEVRDFELPGAPKFDRTTRFAGARRKKFDIDFRCPKAPNETARDWNYAGSYQTVDPVRKAIARLRRGVDFPLEVRIVISKTGEVVEIQNTDGKVTYSREGKW